MPMSEVAGRLALAVSWTCVAIVAVTLLAAATPAFRATVSSSTSGPGYAVGDTIDVPSEVYLSTARSVILFARFDCEACRGAKPFLTDLVDALQGQPTVRVVMVTNHTHRAEQVGFAGLLGLTETEVYSVDVNRLNLRVVPAVAVVDQSGAVVYARAGVSFGAPELSAIRKAALMHTP